MLELLVVVIIIGLLAILAIPRFEQAVEEAKIKEAITVLKSIRGAEKVFKAERGNYVGVNINGTAIDKNNWWTMLKIAEVSDTADWDYGVQTIGAPTGCNPSGGPNAGDWGSDVNNDQCVPFARRARGAEATEVMHIQMSDGVVIGTVSNPGPGQLRNNLGGGAIDCGQQY